MHRKQWLIVLISFLLCVIVSFGSFYIGARETSIRHFDASGCGPLEDCLVGDFPLTHEKRGFPVTFYAVILGPISDMGHG